MTQYQGKSPYMDYRNTVPFVDLSGYIVRQPKIIEETPAKTLREHLLRKRFSTMINFRRFQYKLRVEEYRNGRK